MNASSTQHMALDQLLQGYTDVMQVPPITISGLSQDSRQVVSGDVYIAVQGTQSHGIDYAPAAVKKGAVAILVDSEDSGALRAGQQFDIPVIAVPNLVSKIGELASRYFDQPSSKLPVCGVTGTDGKTSVCRFVADALRGLDFKVGYIGTIGWGMDTELQPNPLTTPDAITLQKMISTLYRDGAQFIVLEVSSHALVQGRVKGVAFDVAVLTNLGRDHLDYHGDIAAYKQAKSQLFDWPGLSAIVLNVGDGFGRELANSLEGRVPVLGYFAGSQTDSAAESTRLLEQASVAHNIVISEQGLSFSLDTGRNVHTIRSGLLGRFNVDNLIASFSVLRAFGISEEQAAGALMQVSAVPGRMERFGEPGHASVIVDFSHTPQALEAALHTLRSHCNGNLWVVFGCGGDRDPGKRKLMGAAAAGAADRVVVTDDNPRSEPSAQIIDGILAGFPSDLAEEKQPTVIASRAQAIEYAMRTAGSDDWILVAGKGHEDYQIVGDQRVDYSDREKVQSFSAQLLFERGGQR